MKKLYNDYFRVSKHEKIRDKVMISQVVLTACIMISCLMATCVTAYACFYYNITTNVLTVKAASFKTDIVIKQVNDTSLEVPLKFDSDTKKRFVELKANTKYFVIATISPNNNANTGFVKITAQNSQNIYHTEQIFKDVTDQITFFITPTAETKVFFEDFWGTSSYYNDYKRNIENPFYIIDGNNDVKILVNSLPLQQSLDFDNSSVQSNVKENQTSSVSLNTQQTSSQKLESSQESSNTNSVTENISNKNDAFENITVSQEDLSNEENQNSEN